MTSLGEPANDNRSVAPIDQLQQALAGRERSEQLRILLLAYANARLRNIIGSNSSAG